VVNGIDGHRGTILGEHLSHSPRGYTSTLGEALGCRRLAVEHGAHCLSHAAALGF